LGWNRQQYYLVFNSALTGLAATLLSQGSTVKQILAMLVFIAGIPACLLGRAAITKGHEYYRRSIYKKTLIEEELGLTKQLVGYTYAGANLTQLPRFSAPFPGNRRQVFSHECEF